VACIKGKTYPHVILVCRLHGSWAFYFLKTIDFLLQGNSIEFSISGSASSSACREVTKNKLGKSVENIGHGKGKGKVHPRTGHEGPEGEQRYSFSLSLTSVQDGGEW
jgi:hypothetical protein